MFNVYFIILGQCNLKIWRTRDSITAEACSIAADGRPDLDNWDGWDTDGLIAAVAVVVS